MAKGTAILAALSLASLLLGRAAPSRLWDLFAVGCALLAFCSWRGRARPSAIKNLSLGIGLLLFVTTGPLLVFSAIAHVGPFEARKEDTFEPNDTFATATRLKAGAEIIASVFPNNPDVFSLDAPAGATIVFRLRSLGHEDCA